MHNKGQVTVLIILGLVILITVGLVLYLTQSQSGVDNFEEVVLDNGVASMSTLDSIVTNCLEDVLYDTPHSVLNEHFFLNNPNLIRNDVPYYYFSGISFLPSIEQLQFNYANKYKEDVLTCIDNFNSVKKYLPGDLVFDNYQFELNINLEESFIVVVAKTHAKIIDGTNVQVQEEIPYSFPSRLGIMYRALDMFIYPPEFENFFYEPGLDYLEKNNFSYVITSEQAGDLMFYLEEIDTTIPERVNYVFAMHNEFSII